MPYQVTIYSAGEREEKRREIDRRNRHRLERAERAGCLCSYQPAKESWLGSQDERIIVRVMRPEGNLNTDAEWHEALLHALNNLDLPTADKRRLIESGDVWKTRPRCLTGLNEREKTYLLRRLV